MKIEKKGKNDGRGMTMAWMINKMSRRVRIIINLTTAKDGQ